jgi:hypothetical protein
MHFWTEKYKEINKERRYRQKEVSDLSKPQKESTARNTCSKWNNV